MATDAGIPGFALTRVAPAKINLGLHVVGQRADGYHLLESLVTFADAGDRIGFSISAEDRFTVSGRFSVDLPLTGEEAAGNLVLKARDLLRAYLTERGVEAGPVHLHLEKNLPVASGIGGGSADAAATLLGLRELWGTSVHIDSLKKIALQLGADVPMCLEGRPLIARGIGEDIERFAEFPSFPMLIVNPLKAVSTPVIFRMLTSKTNPPLSIPQGQRSASDWIATLQSLRNDLEPPARKLEPEIEAVSKALMDTGASFVRMSGSGASCFALFADTDSRDAAATVLSRQNPNWYVLACNSVNGEGNCDGRD
ncbi:4-(cytidine 5'-diphospho)-2-C-methyl-D-erythritol kinase [Rhizobium herbae]|uniref:4-diphosphocytidyl-2-C-methyl-D-erythritol kinase n=1 Tax=Rhizobium herbae TaxID=508661 RepID=A0ABS4ENG5_9HYPH|nr:4-(cytidine 5'-diphospho)-2-C-methyl-D-erythritol kinase [Rhizobium herbae]MBP1859481.1 4-diphosphocytidyl-2-C-methyl-D-erythritol kinase [Rhizobium herbae]